MKTAVIYARYSSDKQTEQSIEGQLRVCEDYAKRNDIIITGTYIDRAMTGTNDNRPDFRKMLNDSKTQKWDYVLVYKFDRFSRNQYESVIHENTLNKNGTKLLSATEIIPETSEGSILKGVIQLMNDYYVKELRQKVKRGMRETRIKGYFQGGKVLYGYKLNGRNVVIDEDEAEVVKYIFSQYNAGVFIRDIINQLNNKNITNRGIRWARTTIYCMLSNSKYTGKYMHENELVDNTYPQIISDEMFEITKLKKYKNKHGSRSIDSNYLLRNKLICGYCGKPITAESGKTKNGMVYRYYKCSGKKAFKNGCTKSQIKKEQLEEFVMNEVIKKLRQPKIMEPLVKTLLEFQKNTKNNQTTFNMLIREQKQTQLAIDNLLVAVEKGIINKSTNNKIIELEEKLEKLNYDISIEQSKASMLLTEEDIINYYDKMLLSDPTIIINYLIKSIKLYDDKMEITFNSPLQTSPVSQGFFFYEKTAKMTFVVPNTKEIIVVDFGIELYI